MNDSILKVIADNPALLEAVRKVIDDKFDLEIPQTDMGLNDLELGQMLRARMVGLRKVEEAFKEISQHKSNPNRPERINPAR